MNKKIPSVNQAKDDTQKESNKNFRNLLKFGGLGRAVKGLGRCLRGIVRTLLGLIRRQPRRAIFGGVSLLLMILIGYLGYILGSRQAANGAGNIVVTAPTKPAPETPLINRPPARLSDNTGFMRLTGQVLSVGEDALVLTLQSGVSISLSASPKTKYFTTDNKPKLITELPVDSTVLVAVEVSPEGYFVASNVRLRPQ